MSIGCGTGGDLIGLLIALDRYEIGKELHVRAIDGNSDTLHILSQIIGKYQNITNKKIILTTIHQNLQNLDRLAEKQIVIDGKKQRGASPTTKGNKGLYLLNVWVSENRICIAQERVEDKSNEITAIPNALASIDITDAIVSIDAMGTQREIAELIVGKSGHYFFAVKNNQKSLYEDIECAFKVH